MYLSCNPGGVGHRWVKRLFVTKKYITNDPNPEKNENPEDYTFIAATVDDNPYLLESSPMYKRQLAQLPEDLMRAHRYGDWDALSGSYFKNFSPVTHTIDPFPIPAHWPRYRSFDYGFDMFACGWWAVDEDGRSWCYRYYEKKGLVAQNAAKAIVDNTPPSETIQLTYAPPDIWSRSKDTGIEVAEKFIENGVPLTKASNNRVQGHMIMKDAMTPAPLKDPYVIDKVYEGDAPDCLPMLMFFRGETQRCVDDICDIQADEANPNDCAKQPHSVTHSVDMVRYYSISRVFTAEPVEPPQQDYEEDDREMDYEEYMCGSDVSEEYFGFF